MDTPRYRVAASTLCRQVNDEMVLLDLAGEQYYALDPVGTRIFLAVTEKSLSSALTALRTHYAIDAERLEHDVVDLVAALLEAGLLVSNDASQA